MSNAINGGTALTASNTGFIEGGTRALASHWPEYLMEAVGLGLFMLAACLFTGLLEYPGSPTHGALTDPGLRRCLTGIAMGLTAIAIIYSPMGKRSGAHLNPSVTLTFWRLGKISSWDAAFYVLFQFVGSTLGVLAAAALMPMVIGHPTVNYAVTLPGTAGRWTAFLAELAISFGLMLTVLTISNRPRLNRYTGLFAGALVAVYISLEAPLSGMSMNPARTFASALPAMQWTDAWIYFLAPPMGMLLAAQAYVFRHGVSAVLCCKLHHENGSRCIFQCRYAH
ncbi:MAG: aquaporin [Betaproteobacteria bacterium]